ncbi:MAG: M43 family zinc metalloprotease [Patescibacteria group bacterium]|nr:M43 family zinc metalloprotease [Patescibacteria group bacterium]
MFYNSGSSNVSISYSVLSDSSRFGFNQSSGTSTLSKVALQGHYYGAYISGGTSTIDYAIVELNTRGVGVTGGTVSVNDSFIADNSAYGIHATTSVDAEDNYWGDDDLDDEDIGPYHPTTNPDGPGDIVSDNVDYDPPEELPILIAGKDSYDVYSVDDDEIRWDGSTTYSSNWSSAVSTWNAEDPVVISQNATGKDLGISDIDNENYEWYAKWYHYPEAVDVILFNEFHMEDLTSEDEKDRVATHELGHALGLSHSFSGNVMDETVTSVSSLGSFDLFTYYYLWTWK